MIEINLLPLQVLRRKEIRYFIIFVSTVAFLSILICFLFSFGVRSKIENAQKQLVLVQEKVKEQQSVLRDLKEWERKKASLLSRLEAMKNLLNRKVLAPRILFEISRCLPENIWIIELTKDIQGGEEVITIQGGSLTQAVDIARFMENLNNSTLFEELNLSSISREESTGVMKFKIICKLRREKD